MSLLDGEMKPARASLLGATEFSEDAEGSEGASRGVRGKPLGVPGGSRTRLRHGEDRKLHFSMGAPRT